MTPWWLIMLSGLLGSSHCLGMCGGFAALVGLNTGTFAANLRAQLCYSAGRIISYSTLGAAAGFAGKRLIESAPQIVHVPAILCLISGLFLIREGLAATGIWRRSVHGHSTTGCLLRPLFSTILKTPGLRNAFTAGILTGLLPCGLVYAFVSLAASSHDLVNGMLTMIAFGVGTIPLMLLAGCGMSWFHVNTRQRIWQISAWSVMATGLLTVARGAAFLGMPENSPPEACPFCAKQTNLSQPSAPASPLATTWFASWK
ncbi:sulfite exporter TauE/SafE family protein [Schlesneria paludicola]|uniref:sulfite exporter TauE/SafE family protein n=1 Tax=Schlesneria paludicola TaxID=360056 RepID=UPI00029A0505|nr:sulfite exporter TauE/SafE family protein [Schlesneria paludicola]